MLVLGIIITIVGLFGTVWAKDYRANAEDLLSAMFGEDTSLGYDLARFFNNNGILIILIGIGLIVYSVYIIKKNDPHVKSDYNPYEAMNWLSQAGSKKPNTPVYKGTTAAQWFSNPETGEYMWKCGRCQCDNPSANVFCSNCSARR